MIRPPAVNRAMFADLTGCSVKSCDLRFEANSHAFHSHWGGIAMALQPRLFPRLMPQTRLHSHCSGTGVALPMLHPICTQTDQEVIRSAARGSSITELRPLVSRSWSKLAQYRELLYNGLPIP